MYVLAKKNKHIRNACKDSELLQAKTIRLKVLAPASYYYDYDERYELAWLENEINRGLEDFLRAQDLDFEMTFKFEKFPLYFRTNKDVPEDDVISKALLERTPVYPQ